MPEFFNVLPPEQAKRLLLKNLSASRVPRSRIPTSQALGRVAASELLAPEDLPSFPRSTMDGFSLRAADTFGASEGLPAYFTVVGAVDMGQAASLYVGLGEAATAYTGGMLAHGADAVIMMEQTQRVDDQTIEVVRPVAPGENVVQVGEDIRAGDFILPKGHVLRPQDLGGLTALGVAEVDVADRPRVAILSMGDEVVPPAASPAPGQIRDVNSYTIAALTQQAGGIPVPLGISPDNFEQQQSSARLGLADAEVLVFSAGSSVSARDMTADVINSLGEPGVLVHGLSLRPGKPAIIGLVGSKPVFGLPGNPVSAMIVFDLLVRPALYYLQGCTSPPEPEFTTAELVGNVASAPGREDYVPVRLITSGGKRTAEPVFGKSNLIYTLVRAHGLIQVPLDKGGLYSGEQVPVRLF